VLDMTVKSTADDGWFYVLALAIMAAAAALALWSYRPRAPGRPSISRNLGLSAPGKEGE
jgi:hypothetical protein